MKIINQIVIFTLVASTPIASSASELIKLGCKGERIYSDNLTGTKEIVDYDFLIELNEVKKTAKFKKFMLIPPRITYSCEFSNDVIRCAVNEDNELKDKMVLDIKISGTQDFFTIFTIDRTTGVATERGLSVQNTTALREDMSFEGRYNCNLIKRKF